MAKIINKYAPNKYITIGGGEPTDQLKNLIILCRELKKYDFNIFVYTWRSIDKILNNDFQNIVPLKSAENFFADFKILLKYIDVIIDGEYVDNLRIYNENSNDGLTSSIGSSNQNICIIKNNILYKKYNMKNIKRIYYINNELKIEEFDLDKLIRDVIKRYYILIDSEGYEFIYENEESIMVMGDKKRIEQVVYNLINNAINYTGDDKKVYIELVNDKKKVTVKIRDTGKGI